MDLMRVLKNVITNPPYPSSWATLYLAQNRCVRILTSHFRGVACSTQDIHAQIREKLAVFALQYTVGLAWIL